MTATGTLYVDEDCRDFFKAKLDKWYGEDKWRLDGDEFDYWDMSQFPKVIVADVRDDDTDEMIGKVQITSKFIVENDEGSRYVECEPYKIKRLKYK